MVGSLHVSFTLRRCLFFLVPSTVSNRGQMDSSAQLQEVADEVCQRCPFVGDPGTGNQRLYRLLLRHWGHSLENEH